MHIPSILLSLVAAASAIDIRFMTDNNCNGLQLACANINPGVCCEAGQIFAFVSFMAVPATWSTDKFGYDSGDCTSGNQFDNNSKGDYCAPVDWFYRSAMYNFNSRKAVRGVGEAPKSQRVDTLILEDGTRMDISGLNDQEFEFLVEQANNGTVTAAIDQFALPIVAA